MQQATKKNSKFDRQILASCLCSLCRSPHSDCLVTKRVHHEQQSYHACVCPQLSAAPYKTSAKTRGIWLAAWNGNQRRLFKQSSIDRKRW